MVPSNAAYAPEQALMGFSRISMRKTQFEGVERLELLRNQALMQQTELQKAQVEPPF